MRLSVLDFLKSIGALPLKEQQALVTEELAGLLNEIDGVSLQLDNAKDHFIETGKYADPKWFTAATHSKRKKGRQVQALQQAMKDLKRSIYAEGTLPEGEKKERQFSWWFLKAAKLLLTGDQVLMISERAEMLEKEGGQ